MIRLLVWVLALTALPACSERPIDFDSYFPLAEGLSWTYRVTTMITGSQNRETRFREYNAEPETLNGIRYTVRVTDQGTRYYIGENADGIFRAAKRTVVELDPHPDKAPRWILKHPFRIGTTWSHESHPYVLRRLQPYEEGLARGARFKMAYQIASLDETVEVPGGRFVDCIRVDGDAQLAIYAGGRIGYQDIQIDTSEWYAPGVGLVKLVREEPLSTAVFAGGRVVFELERFDWR